MADRQYEHAILLDADLNPRLIYPEGPPHPLDALARATATQALRTGNIAVADLHSETDAAQHIHLDLMVPLIARPNGTNDPVVAAGLEASPLPRAVGLLVLEVDARDLLFPLIQSWPIPSRSAETLLVRREGREVIYLNELRHRPGTAMKIRRPIDEPSLPASMAARGERGVKLGVDYRAVRVVATLRAVPQPPG